MWKCVSSCTQVQRFQIDVICWIRSFFVEIVLINHVKRRNESTLHWEGRVSWVPQHEYIPPISPASLQSPPRSSIYFSLFLFLFCFVFFYCPPTTRQPNENKGINVARKQLHLTSISIPRHAAAQMNLCLKCLRLAASIHSLQPATSGLKSHSALLQHA